MKATVLPTGDLNGVTWKLESRNLTGKIFYGTGDSIDPAVPYSEPINVKENSKLTAKYVGPDFLTTLKQDFYINKATGKKITLTNQPSRLYQGDGAFTLVNGVQNEKGLEKPREFLGFNGTDCEAVIDLGSVQQISDVKAHVFEEISSWIWRPKYFQVLISPDDKTYTEMGMTDVIQLHETKSNGVMTVQQKSVAARYLKIKLGNYGFIPEGSPGSGNKAWLFVDEIEVN